MTERCWLAGAAATVLSACVVTGDAGALTAGESGEPSTSVTISAGEDDTGGGTTDSSGAPPDKLDVAVADVEAMECASVEQTTQIEARPSDIILIADRDVSREAVQDQVTNLLPGMQSLGVFDANVVHVFDGAPPPEIPGSKFDCGAWACRGASAYRAVYAEVEQPVPPGGILAAVLATVDQWSPHMRPEAWKHVWISTTADAELGLTNAEFREQLQAQLDALGSETGFFVHTLGAAIRFTANSDGYTGLAEDTEGVYDVGLSDFSLFQGAVVDAIKGNALACEYEIPAPPDGQVFDQGKVNVDYEDGFGIQTVGYVQDVIDCPTVNNGWYYDDLVDPGRILMCPQTCARFDVLREASIEIRFGCTTIPAG